MNNDEKTMRQILTEVRAALEAANNDPSGPITDTIWMPPTRNETLFDFIDAALATPPSKVVAESVATPNLSVEEIACMGFDAFRALQGKPTQRYSAEQIAQAIMQIVNGTWLPGGAPQVQAKIKDIIADAIATPARATLEGADLPPLPAGSMTRQEKLLALADRIDHEKLWRQPAMDRHTLTDDQQARLDAGVMLRRYADILAPGRWLVIPPTGGIQFGAGSLNAAYEMAKRDEARKASDSAAPPQQKEET